MLNSIHIIDVCNLWIKIMTTSNTCAQYSQFQTVYGAFLVIFPKFRSLIQNLQITCSSLFLQDGTFLVRRSEKPGVPYVLAVWYRRTFNLTIKNIDGRLYLGTVETYHVSINQSYIDYSSNTYKQLYIYKKKKDKKYIYIYIYMHIYAYICINSYDGVICVCLWDCVVDFVTIEW